MLLMDEPCLRLDHRALQDEDLIFELKKGLHHTSSLHAQHAAAARGQRHAYHWLPLVSTQHERIFTKTPPSSSCRLSRGIGYDPTLSRELKRTRGLTAMEAGRTGSWKVTQRALMERRTSWADPRPHPR